MKFASSAVAKRGFTLIELLVVIAIIGILSSVVLASLNTARSKGTDAKIQSEIRSIAVNAELFYDSNNNSYGTAATACTATSGTLWGNANVAQIVTDLTNATSASNPVCNSSATAFAISHQMTASTTQYFCADSTGKAGLSSTALGTNTVCP
ncbi:MAG TPA: type II secretion system protein [Candidatus Paceibacterota bacterium]|nr:type II secretion system protein [Candidatus Paceibacterota bacterium]